MANEQNDKKQSYNESDNFRIEIAILQEPIKAFIPGFAKFKIPPLMTDKNNVNNQTSEDTYIELYVPYEYTFCWGADVVAEGTRFLVASVGANLNDLRIIGRYDYNASIPQPTDCIAHYIIEIIMLNERQQAVLKSCYENDKNIYCHHHGTPHLDNILDIVPNPYKKSDGAGDLGGLGGGDGGLGDAAGGLGGGAGDSMGGLDNASGGMGSGFGDSLGNNLDSAIDNSIGGLTPGAGGGLGDISNSLNDINNSLSGLSDIANNVGSSLGNIANNITNITNAADLSNLSNSLSNLSSSITDMVNGVSSVLSNVENTVSGVFNTSTLLGKNVQPISSDYNYFQNSSTSSNNKSSALESFIANTNNYGYLTKQGERTIMEKVTRAINN